MPLLSGMYSQIKKEKIPGSKLPMTGRDRLNFHEQVSINPCIDKFGLIGINRQQYYIINFSLNMPVFLMKND
jgi:hypothetical protein